MVSHHPSWFYCLWFLQTETSFKRPGKRKVYGKKEVLFHHLRTILCHILFYTNEDCQEPVDQSLLPALLDQIDGEAQGILNCSLPAQNIFQGASATLNVVLQEKLKFHLRNSSLTREVCNGEATKTPMESKRKNSSGGKWAEWDISLKKPWHFWAGIMKQLWYK